MLPMLIERSASHKRATVAKFDRNYQAIDVDQVEVDTFNGTEVFWQVVEVTNANGHIITTIADEKFDHLPDQSEAWDAIDKTNKKWEAKYHALQ